MSSRSLVLQNCLLPLRSKAIPATYLKMPIPVSVKRKNLHYSSSLKGDMLKFSKELPTLPVPELKDTAKTYLQSIKPFVKNQEQYQIIKTKLEEFISPGGLGEVLQGRLKDRASKTDNWISEWWDNDAYLAYRDPVVPYVSYFFSHASNLLPKTLEKSQLKKATILVDKVLDFKELIATENFPPEVIKGTPYCMNGFTMMFNNSRIPGEAVDDTISFSQTELQNQFIVVIKNNRFYKLYHQDANGKRLDHYQIHQGLMKISEDANAKDGSFRQPAVGALTTLDRDSWYQAFSKLYNFSIINANSFEDIFRSSFVLCLDNVSPISFEERSRNCWHGDGENRYFDKPLQFFVAANGASGFLGEHSRMDGTPNLTLNNYVCKEMARFKNNELFDNFIPTNVELIESEPKELKFDISKDVASIIKSAEQKFRATAVDGHLLKVWRYQGYGKTLIKKFNTSPDAFVQILMQLAYYKYTGTLKPTYESATTRKYKLGRTETNRTVSSELLDFVKTFNNPKATIEEKIKTYRAAIAQQNDYIKLASSGLAVDRHIYGLKKSLKNGESSEFLSDPMTSYSSTWYLSTSQLSSEYFNGYGWSEVHEIGLGLPYMINREWLNITITCKTNNPAGLDPEKMHYYLTEAADELKEVLSNELKSKL
ncbi:carnitine O-acetyltransferase [Saccharomycopsis crataegensis]|uniref:Carnitine O-acetyltransferase, mitochondrial n=1 Tax=Saccharomycopsis crataegensis TaxID=43959 RepID=A0AAV5QPY3_9ASCO|nr:carnitine O-acetyltransferase [Saccharomycopsis crataegensis]